MKIRDIIDNIVHNTNLVIKLDSIVIYEGDAEDLPYWIAEKEFTAHQCIEVENNSLVIDTSKPIRNNNDNKKWIDITEEDTILNIAGFLYKYDVCEHDEQFDEKEWSNVFDPMIEYLEKRFGSILFSEKMKDWYRNIR